MIRVAIVDDHAMVRAGLRELLGGHDDIAVTAECATAREALDAVRLGGIDVLLLDISMPGHTGIDVLRSVKARASGLPVLILSSFPEEHYAVTLLRQGAAGYLAKDADPDEIVRAIRLVAGGRRYVTPAVAEQLAADLVAPQAKAAHERLTERELQVFLRLARGETVGQVAQSMSLSVKTVSTYRSRLMEALGLSSNSELTYYALKHGLMQ